MPPHLPRPPLRPSLCRPISAIAGPSESGSYFAVCLRDARPVSLFIPASYDLSLCDSYIAGRIILLSASAIRCSHTCPPFSSVPFATYGPSADIISAVPSVSVYLCLLLLASVALRNGD